MGRVYLLRCNVAYCKLILIAGKYTLVLFSFPLLFPCPLPVCVMMRFSVLWYATVRFGASRWHGKSNLVITLRQLQRTAALVFPQEVVNNGENKK